MGEIWGACAADATRPSEAAGRAARSRQDGHGAGNGAMEHPTRLPANSQVQVDESFSANLHYYHPYDHHAFPLHHVHSAHRTLSPIVVNAAAAPDLDDDNDGCSSQTTPVTPYPPLSTGHSQFPQSNPGSESRRLSLAFHESSASPGAAFAFGTDHQQPRPHPLLQGCMDDVDDTASASHSSRPPSCDRDPLPSDRTPARLAAYTTTLVLRQGPPFGTRLYPDPTGAQEPTHMVLDDPQHCSAGLAHMDESDSAPNTPCTTLDVPASTGRRPRGRPRLETRDQTPADRRRTQVRLAQRGFRQRKEELLKSLKRRVTELESVNESMCAEFAQFHDFVRSERVFSAHSLVAKRLQIIADSFFASALAAKEAWGGSGGSQSSDADNEPLAGYCARGNTASSSGLPSQMHRSSSIGDHPQQGYFPGSGAVTPSGHNTHIPLSISYGMVTQPTADNASFPYYANMESLSPDVTGQYYTKSTAVSPMAYAGHDMSFGRRLQRASMEAGWRLITMANPPAERYAAAFGFRLFFESRETIIRRLRLFSVGPFNCEVMPIRDERLDHRMRTLYPGFEHEFFNADEVETYLGRLGITIPQNAEYVEAEVQLSSLEEASPPWSPFADEPEAPKMKAFINSPIESSDSTNSTASGTMAGRMWLSSGFEAEKQKQVTAPPAGAGNVHPPTATAMGGSGTSGSDDIDARFHPAMCSSSPDGMWGPTGNWPRTKIAIDVNIMIDEMVHRSVCLGKVPGVRRRDVNRAVKLAAGLAAR